MRTKTFFQNACVIIALTSILMLACSPPASPTSVTPTTIPTEPTSATPDWFDVELTDVKTGETFTINDFAGKVVLIETMAQWCPTCRTQQDEIKKLHDLLGENEDVVSISLDVDLNEDADSLKEYVEELDYDWHFAIAPLEVDRALGNLYSAEYLNPPLAPMLLIDREGSVYGLPFGVKNAGSLQLTVESYLVQ